MTPFTVTVNHVTEEDVDYGSDFEGRRTTP
jgi:hypothetical protein